MQEARAAVEQAPDGRWIAASEWQVRDIFQRLTRDCYQAMLQAKADAHPTASLAALPPAAPALRNKGTHTRRVLSVGGEVELSRRYFRAKGAGGVYPVDEAAGID